MPDNECPQHNGGRGDAPTASCILVVREEISAAFNKYEQDRKSHPFTESEINALARAVRPIINEVVDPIKEEFNEIKVGLRVSRYWIAVMMGVCTIVSSIIGPLVVRSLLDSSPAPVVVEEEAPKP